jgi:hypothetical protein
MASVLLFATYRNLTSVTVADDLRKALGPGVIVDCDPDNGDWACRVNTISGGFADCPEGLRPVAMRSVGGLVATVPSADLAAPCQGTVTAPVIYDVTATEDRAVATIRQSQAELSENRSRIKVIEMEQNRSTLFRKFIAKVKGRFGGK